MNAEYCEQCGQPIDPRWVNYCCRCGRRFNSEGWSGKYGSSTDGGFDWIQSIKTFAVNHPVLFVAGIIGAGIGALMAAPFVMHAGVALTLAGLIVAAAGWYVAVKRDDDEPQDRQPNAGIKVGILMIAGGALVYLLSYLMVAVGGVSVVAGAGIGTYKGVRMLKKSKEVKLVVGKCCQAVPKAGRRVKTLLSQFYRKIRKRVPGVKAILGKENRER